MLVLNWKHDDPTTWPQTEYGDHDYQAMFSFETPEAVSIVTDFGNFVRCVVCAGWCMYFGLGMALCSRCEHQPEKVQAAVNRFLEYYCPTRIDP